MIDTTVNAHEVYRDLEQDFKDETKASKAPFSRTSSHTTAAQTGKKEGEKKVLEDRTHVKEDIKKEKKEDKPKKETHGAISTYKTDEIGHEYEEKSLFSRICSVLFFWL